MVVLALALLGLVFGSRCGVRAVELRAVVAVLLPSWFLPLSAVFVVSVLSVVVVRPAPADLHLLRARVVCLDLSRVAAGGVARWCHPCACCRAAQSGPVTACRPTRRRRIAPRRPCLLLAAGDGGPASTDDVSSGCRGRVRGMYSERTRGGDSRSADRIRQSRGTRRGADGDEGVGLDRDGERRGAARGGRAVAERGKGVPAKEPGPARSPRYSRTTTWTHV